MHRFIGLLLRLYSKTFRSDFGDQAVTFLKQDMKDAPGGGVIAPLRRIKLLLDFAVHGILDRVQRTWTETVGSDATIMDGWLQDARLALRSTLRRPGFVFIAVTSLIFGVGANAVVFSVVDSLMLRDIPGATEPDRIVDLDIRRANGNRRGWDFPTFMDVRNRSGLLEHFALISSGTVNLASDGPGQVLPVKYVTSGYFESLGVVPRRGRTFGADEDFGPGEHAVAVLGHTAWIRTFNADPNILGKEIRLNRESYVVVGVVPEDFKGRDFGVEPHFYLPITQHPSARQAPERYFESRGTEWAQVMGRLNQGVDRKALNAELESIFRSIGEENPDTNLGVSATAGRAESEDGGWIQTDIMSVTPGIFETMGIDLRSGRSFDASDGRLTPRVAVVNQLLAERAWPDDQPVGQVVEFGIDPVAYTIIGVVENTQSDLATDDFTPQIYSLLSQDYISSVAIVARETNAPDDFVAQLRREILAVDPALALGATMELAFLAELGTLPYRLTASITSILGGLALFLSGIGVYGIVAFMVSQQTREIGVRIALGASRNQVRGRVVKGGLVLTLPGFAIGILLAGALARVVGAVIPGIRALDPLAYGAVAVILLVTVTLASFVPARRASLVQPMDALRQD